MVEELSNQQLRPCMVHATAALHTIGLSSNLLAFRPFKIPKTQVPAMLSGSWWVEQYIREGQVPMLLSRIFWVIFAICLHELAHGWAAIWQGDDTPRRLNRMTMNPLVHMGGMSLIVFALIGIAWGLMPVDPSRFRNRRWGRVLVAAAGPAMNIALAIVSLSLLGVWMHYGRGIGGDNVYDNIAEFLFVGGWLNLVLAAFNLLPIPPLDGSQVLSGLSFRMQQFFQTPQSQMFGLFILLAILITGMGVIFLDIAITASHAYLSLVQQVLP